MEPTFILGALIIQMSVSLTFVGRKGLAIYSAYLLLLAIPVLTIDTLYPKPYIIASILTVFTMMWVTMEGKRVLVSRMQKQRHIAEMQNAELAELNREINEREKRFYNLVEAIVDYTDQSLYSQLVKTLTQIFEVDYAFIGSLISDTNKIEPIAFAKSQDLVHRDEFKLTRNPGERAIKEGIISIQKGVREMFPHSLELGELAVEGYLGCVIKDSSGAPLGYVSILSKYPLSELEFKEKVLRVVAARAGAEIERVRRNQIILDRKLQMVESARLASLGEMAGGIAHEINNPLAIIDGYAGILMQSAQVDKLDSEQVVEVMQKVRQTCSRIGKIIKGLRVVARDAEGEPLKLHLLNDIIEDTMSLSYEKAKSLGIKIIVDDHDNKLQLECRRVQISQVLTNMINNSIYAVRELAEKWIRLEVSVEPVTNNAVIIVTDSGAGIPPEVRPKLMRPFFTTKEVGEGTGLGLSVSLGILKDHGGTILLNERSKHTEFHIIFGTSWVQSPQTKTAS